jgi:membrane protease YdiL (CAAX protease family)
VSLLLFLYLALVLAVLPLLSWRAARRGAILAMPRPTLYRTSLVTAWGLSLLGGAVLWMDGALRPADLGLRLPSPGRLTTATALTCLGVAAAAVALAGARLLLAREESHEVVHLVPRTPEERQLFGAVAITAGLTEEFVFRGIALHGLAASGWLGAGEPAAWRAAGVTALAFGLGHGYQDPLGMVRAGLLGGVLAVPVILTGSLLPSMTAHALLDLSLLAWGRALVAQEARRAGRQGTAATPTAESGIDAID